VEQSQSIIEDVGDFLWDVVKAVSPVDLGAPTAPRPVTAEAMIVMSLQEQVEQVKIQLEQVEIEIKRCLASIENFKKRIKLARGLPRDSVLRAMARSFDR
jgi:molecular chaperone GrpE (heat shock protein)